MAEGQTAIPRVRRFPRRPISSNASLWSDRRHRRGQRRPETARTSQNKAPTTEETSRAADGDMPTASTSSASGRTKPGAEKTEGRWWRAEQRRNTPQMKTMRAIQNDHRRPLRSRDGSRPTSGLTKAQGQNDLLQFDINAATADIRPTGRLLKTAELAAAGPAHDRGQHQSLRRAAIPVTAVLKNRWRDNTGTTTALILSRHPRPRQPDRHRRRTGRRSDPRSGSPARGYLAGYDGEQLTRRSLTLGGICLRLVGSNITTALETCRARHRGQRPARAPRKYRNADSRDLQALLAPFRRIGTG